MPSYSLLLENEQQTLALGQKIAAHSDALHVIYLNGPLGAGKTTLTRGILQGLGYQGTVKSPTYTLVESYPIGTRIIHHFDLYRLQGSVCLEEMGFRDYFTPDTLCLIEWPEKIDNALVADLICHLTIVDDARKIELLAKTTAGHQLVAAL